MSGWTRDVAGAYSSSADAWATGPGRIYDVLADVLVDRCPTSLDGRLLLDVGAGRGAASRAIERAGGTVVALDVAEDMIAAARRTGGPPGAVADAVALPIASASVGGVAASFSYNHVTDPVAALAEARRVVRRGGVVLASAYASDDDHPVRGAVDAAATAVGWAQPPWLSELRRDAAPLLATVERATAVLAAAGFTDGTAVHVEVPFPDLRPVDLVAWRLGMAGVAPFLAERSPALRDAVTADALARLGPDPPPLVRRMIVLTAIV